MAKIVFILPTLHTGGAERVLRTLYHHYKGERKEIIVLDGSGPLREGLAGNAGFSDLGARSVRRGLLPLLCALREKRPDVIVSTMAHMNFGVLLLKPFLRGQPKIIVREANMPSAIIAKQKWKRTLAGAYRFLYRWADRVIAPSRRIVDDFSSSLGIKTDRYEVLYNPVDADYIRAKAVQGFSAGPARTVHFVCVGRLVYAKGLDCLIESLKDFSPRHEWRLTIVGEGVERPALEAMIAARGLHDRVTLVGLQDNPWGYMAAADALLLPSRWEGLPNVALEALTLGTPVIALASAGGIAEIAELAPDHVVVAGTMPEFIRAMERVVPSGHACVRSSVLPDIFSLASVMARFDMVLNDVLSKGRAS